VRLRTSHLIDLLAASTLIVAARFGLGTLAPLDPKDR
jgi:hypothetical protein